MFASAAIYAICLKCSYMRKRADMKTGEQCSPPTENLRGFVQGFNYTNDGAVALRINTTIYCANFKFANQYIVCEFLSATAPNSQFSIVFSTHSSSMGNWFYS